MLPDSSSNKKTIKGLQQTDEIVAQDALNMTGFGKFNYKILAISTLICMNVSFSILSVGFILPTAACDLKMTTTDKGHLTVSIMLGFFSSSYFWGCFADVVGRRTSLLVSLFIHGCSEFFLSVMQFYWGFLILKFISGLAICGQITVLYTYLAEFQPRDKRDYFLSSMEPAWIFGAILVVCVAWITVPLNIEYKAAVFSFHSWNLFILICSLPALAIGIWLIFFPETPKYLAETGQNAKMFEILAKMYSENTGNPAKEYFVHLKTCDNPLLSELVSQTMAMENKEDIIKQSWNDILVNICNQTLILLKRPYLRRTIILCVASYLIMSSYYMLVLWLPDIFQKYAEFQERYPNQPASVCTVIIAQTNETTESMDPYGCDMPMQNSVYIHTFIITLACIPTAISLPLLINRTGYTFFLILSTIIGSLVTLCFFLGKTSTDNLIVACFFESFTSVCVSVVCCMVVDLYPTNLRSIAAGLAALFGRLGSIMGTFITSVLVDNYCTTLISVVSVQLFLCGIISLFIPKKNELDKMDITTTKSYHYNKK